MGTQGSFGYKIGRKIRLMHVPFDADLLWQICVREIYVLMKHYGTIEHLREAFEQLQEAKHTPKPDAIDKCKWYTDLNKGCTSTNDWYSLTRYCQHSFINILDSGYFLNNGEKTGLILLLDFNTNVVRFYNTKRVDFITKEEEFEKATISDIMEFSDMPYKSYTDIIAEHKTKHSAHKHKIQLIDAKIVQIQSLINKAMELAADMNIIQQTSTLLRDAEIERNVVNNEYNYFYDRLDALHLIESN